MRKLLFSSLIFLSTLFLSPVVDAAEISSTMDVNNIADQLFFVSVRLVCMSTGADGKPKENIGTGFLVSYKWAENKEGLFLVTNKHVLLGVDKVRFFFTKSDGKNPILGSTLSIDITDMRSGWFGHPDDKIDVAIIPVSQVINAALKKNLPIFFRSFSKDFVPTSEQVKELYAIEDVMFVGYPIAIYDKVNFLPIVRRGITATPFSVDYEGLPQFLIDASVFPGSSGSPVFIMNQGAYSTKNGNYPGPRFLFLGMISKGYGYVDSKEFSDISPVAGNNQLVGLGSVIKSTTIFETIEGFLKITGEIKQTEPAK